MKTIKTILQMKLKGQPITVLTAYDYITARILDESDVDIILVGDSMGNVIYGYDSTIPVTMEDMIRHTQAVRRGCQNAFLLSDLPFASYHGSIDHSLKNAADLIRAGARGVKVEGATPSVLDVIRHYSECGIVVFGHLGFTPQQLNRFGGIMIKGRDKDAAKELSDDAQALVSAGVQGIVLECVPAKLAAKITTSVPVPVIGIGAGVHCDGQVLVTHDAVGLYPDFTPRFVRQYAKLNASMKRAVKKYVKEVRNRDFPGDENSY